MPRTRSIRARLLIGNLFSLIAILALAAWWSYEVASHESEELFGARLATSARVLDAFVARQVGHATIASPLVVALPKELEHAADDSGSAAGHPYETKIAFQVWRDDGALLVRSASASERPFSRNVAGFSSEVVDGELYHVFVLQSGNTWIQVAEKNEVRDELIHDLGVAVMTPLIVGAVLLLIVVNLLVLYGLAPLRQLASDIEARQPGAPGPLPLSEVPQEVTPVVRALNDLLVRVERALEHERRFTDAAAHELRTPIAALRIHADNAMRAGTEVERRQSMQRLSQCLERTAKLASQMLTYSRTQNASDSEAREVLRLPQLVRETTASLEPLRQEKSQQIRIVDETGGDATILGERSKIQSLILNLCDNASRYAPDGSTIEVAVRAERDRVLLSVANHGEPIPAALRDRVFEPYYRVPGSASDGSGLGLSIVREIAAQHGATVGLDPLGERDGTVVTVRFPAAAQAITASATAK